MFCRLAGMAALCVAVLGIAGCGEGAGGGPKLHPVKGTVKYKGAPLANATVSFISDSGHVSTGVTDAQGQYSLMSGGRTGAAAGSYKVTITKLAQREGAVANPKPEDMAKMMSMKTKTIEQPKSEIPEKYADPVKSGLTATVTTDTAKNVFDFELSD